MGWGRKVEPPSVASEHPVSPEMMLSTASIGIALAILFCMLSKSRSKAIQRVTYSSSRKANVSCTAIENAPSIAAAAAPESALAKAKRLAEAPAAAEVSAAKAHSEAQATASKAAAEVKAAEEAKAAAEAKASEEAKAAAAAKAAAQAKAAEHKAKAAEHKAKAAAEAKAVAAAAETTAAGQPATAHTAEVVGDGPLLAGGSSRDDTADDDQDDDAEVEVSDSEQLTARELKWIVAIRDGIAAQSLTCTNVELVQLAIVCKGSVSRAVSRLKKLEAWRSKYHLDDISFEKAYRDYNAAATVNGSGILHTLGRAHSGAPGFTVNYSEFLPRKLEYQHAFKSIFGVFEACCSSLAGVRRGTCIVAECSGVGYSNVSLAAEVRFASIYVGGYPVRIDRIVLVDVTTVVRLTLKALKRVLPAKMAAKFQLSSTAGGQLFAEHVPPSNELPGFLGGSAGAGQQLVDASVAKYKELHAARAAWDRELIKAYGEGFKDYSGPGVA
jgi:hypothetical protein